MLNCIDIILCVIRVDPCLNYVTYLVTAAVTGVSTRHLLSMAKSLVYVVDKLDNYI